MIVSSVDGKKSKWKMEVVEKTNQSQLHKNARILIENIFKTAQIKEEVQIEVKKNKRLYLDYYLPLYRLAIEINGKQHSSYSDFFSKNPLNFIKQKINDKLKQDWCELNNITLIRLNYSEEPHEWRQKLLSLGFPNDQQSNA